MGQFLVDETKCRRDGICVATCPVGILALREGALPARVPGGDDLCIACGQCVAVCPHGACSITEMPVGSCPPVRPEWRLSPEQAEHFLRSRRSIRVYKEKQVDPGTLERLIGVARYAPSGHNRQPVRWLVISGREPVRALAGHVVDWMRHFSAEKPGFARRMLLDRIIAGWEAGQDPVCRGAHHVIVTHAPKTDVTAPAACTLALAYLELAAPSFGLGACWAGYLQLAATLWPPLQEALALPQGDACCGAMLVGEPKFRYARLPARKEAEITWR
jgi:nitroreductase/NAD-dependent dihydropyrimidine dehydrogenase PreA subunit